VLRRVYRAIQQDSLLRTVLKSSGYLLSSSSLSAVLSFLQGIVGVWLLGMDGFGLVNGTILIFASNIHSLFSFRMSDAVVKYFGEALTIGARDRAAAVAKGSGLVEAATSFLAYAVLWLSAPWAAQIFADSAALAPLFRFYGVVLLANLVYETATGVLRSTRRFGGLAAINLGQSFLTAALILAAYLFRGQVLHVLAAYLAGKMFAGVAVGVLAGRALAQTVSPSWWRVSLHCLTDWRSLARFTFSTNLNGTVNLLARDSAPLLLAVFRPNDEVGYFKLALNLVALMMLPIEPFIWPTYAEITRTVAQRQWAVTRQLLRRVSAIAAGWTLLSGGAMAALGWWLIPWIWCPTAAPAYPAVLILWVGYGFANIFNWNRPLLLALGKPVFPLAVGALAGAIEIALALWLTPTYGYLAQSAVLSGYFLLSVSVIVWRGASLVRQLARSEVDPP